MDSLTFRGRKSLTSVREKCLAKLEQLASKREIQRIKLTFNRSCLRCILEFSQVVNRFLLVVVKRLVQLSLSRRERFYKFQLGFLLVHGDLTAGGVFKALR